MQRLDLDATLEVLLHLDSKSLAAVAPTCRDIYGIANPLLYEDVHFPPSATHIQVILFLKTAAECPHLASRVKRLDLWACGMKNHHMRDLYIPPFQSIVRLPAGALFNMVHLESLDAPLYLHGVPAIPEPIQDVRENADPPNDIYYWIFDERENKGPVKLYALPPEPHDRTESHNPPEQVVKLLWTEMLEYACRYTRIEFPHVRALVCPLENYSWFSLPLACPNIESLLIQRHRGCQLEMDEDTEQSLDAIYYLPDLRKLISTLR